MEDAIDRGAQIIRVNPGRESFSGQTRKIPSTLIVEVADEMAVLRLPILGPVLAVRAYPNLDEVVEHATRGTDLGSVCWFDTDVGRAGAMIPRLSPPACPAQWSTAARFVTRNRVATAFHRRYRSGGGYFGADFWEIHGIPSKDR